MREWIARLTHPSRFRPGLVLVAAVGVTALFFAVIAVNVHLARQRLVSGVFALLLSAVWVVIVLMMRRFYEAQARTETALRESETKYRALIDVLPHGVVIMQDRVLLFGNPAAAAMLGFTSADDLVGLPWETFIAERDRERVRGIAEARARGEAGVPTQYPVVMQRGDQEEFPAEVYVRSFQFGGCFVVQAVILDVTEQRRAEEALRESEERFRNLADQAPVLMWMAGVKRHTYYFNRTWQTFTGRSTAQEYGQGWQQGAHPEDLPRVLATYESAFASRSPFIIEYRLRHADGLYHWVLDTGVPRFASEQRFTGYIGSCVDISGRREAEQALRESEERFRTLYNKTPAMLQSIDAKGRLVGISDFWLEAMGYEHNEVIGRPISDFLFPQSPSGGGASSPSLLLNNGDIKNVSQQFVTKSGRVMDAIVSAVAERDADGNVQGSLAVIMDVTDLKRAENALRMQAQILDEIRDAVIATDLEARITSWNKGAERLYGYGADEVMGRHLSFLYADPAALENDVVAPLLEHGTHASEARLKRKSGEEFDAQIYLSCSYDGQGQRQGMIGYSLDITERKRAEEVLLVSKAHLLNAIRIAKLGYWEYDFVKDVFTFNDEFYALFQTTVEQVGGYTMPAARYAELFVHPEDIGLVAEEVRKAAESTNPNYSWQLEHRIVYGDGKTGHIAVRFQIVKDSEGRTIRSYGMNQDITERKRAADALIAGEEQLRQSQKMEAIGRMAGGIAHDFNNLLTCILGHNEIMVRGLSADHPLRDDIREVAKAAERAAALTRQLLTFSRKQVLQPRRLDLNAIVTDMEKMLRRLIREDVELLTRLQPDLGTTKADRSQIEQVLMNLVMNARDAMPAGGRLIIETANVAPDEIQDWRRKKAAPAPYVLLAVSDNGTGMDAETRSHIYEPFFTTKEQGKGTGLGLSTVYGIVKQSGGHIWVYSELGRGTVFRIYFPRVEGTVEPLTEPETSLPPHRPETIPGGD